MAHHNSNWYVSGFSRPEISKYEKKKWTSEKNMQAAKHMRPEIQGVRQTVDTRHARARYGRNKMRGADTQFAYSDKAFATARHAQCPHLPPR